MKRVAVLQSNYLPWKGYFDIIRDVDLFIFYDDVQYTKNDWRNRNRIKTSQGVQWLTIPTGGDLNRLVCEVRLDDSSWQHKHWKTLSQAYSRAPYFGLYRDFFEKFYMEGPRASLSELNQFLIRSIAKDFLGIKTEFRDSREFGLQGKRGERLLDLLKQSGAELYVSGPAAKSYIDTAEFKNQGIDVAFKDYSSYPEYSQLYPPFEHAVSVVDVLFNCGAEAGQRIWGWRKAA